MDRLLDFLPEELHGRVVVAGGYAVDARLAEDIDLWVPAAGLSAELAIQHHLDARGLSSAMDVADGSYDGRRLVATIEHGYEGKNVQILTSNYLTAQQLVDSFDISTHMLAKRIVGPQVTFGSKWTSKYDQPQVLRFTTPEHTLQRLVKICDRYGTKPRWDDVVKLNAAVAQGRQEAA